MLQDAMHFALPLSQRVNEETRDNSLANSTHGYTLVLIENKYFIKLICIRETFETHKLYLQRPSTLSHTDLHDGQAISEREGENDF